MKIKIIYTSDIHGKVSSFDFNKMQYLNDSGLISISKHVDENTILLDNGDFFQGSPYSDSFIKDSNNELLVANVFNKLNYKAVNIGNHEFNYGIEKLLAAKNKLNMPLLGANSYYNNKNIGVPYIIIDFNNYKIGILGLVTDYIPNWEKPDNLVNISFTDPFVEAKKYQKELKEKCDFTIILYHGGLELNPFTNEQLGEKTTENIGYKLAKDLDYDLLLLGHQHLLFEPFKIGNTTVLEIPNEGKVFGLIEIDTTTKDVTPSYIYNNGEDINEIYQEIDTYTKRMVAELNQVIGYLPEECYFDDPFKGRLEQNKLFTYINQAIIDFTKADVVATSLPNHAKGFHKEVTVAQLKNNFTYPNVIYVLEITGKILKEAILKSIEYFNSDKTINQKYVYPKLEHYNYDIFGNIEYEIDLSKENRLVKLTKDNKEILDNDILTLAVNNYRAIGGGNFNMYKKAKIIKKYDETLLDIFIKYLKNKPKFIENNYLIK